MDHAAFTELIAGRALGDLDVAEQRAVDAHLRGCAACRATTRDLDRVLTELAFAAPPRPVPAALGASIMAAIHREASLPMADAQPARSTASLPAMHARTRAAGWGRALGVGLAAAAVLAIGVLGLEVIRLRDQVTAADRVARATADQLITRNTAMQVVADPAHASAWLAPSTGDVTASALMVYLPGSTEAFLVATGLPAAPAGHDYQFWYADSAGVHPGVTFDHDGTGVLILPVDVDLRGATAAMLTIEQDGGAAGGPSQDIVFGELPAS